MTMSDALIAGGLFLALLAAIIATSFSRGPRWATPVPAARPVVHVGATVGYGRALARMARDLPSEDLRTVPEQMVADHQALDTIGAAQAAFVARVDAALAAFTDRLPAELKLRLEAAAWQTGELDRAELERLLAADDELATVSA